MSEVSVEWEVYEGMSYGYAEDSSFTIEISAYDNGAGVKWGEGQVKGRYWWVFDEHNNIVAKGHSKDLRVAKKEALFAAKSISK